MDDEDNVEEALAEDEVEFEFEKTNLKIYLRKLALTFGRQVMCFIEKWFIRYFFNKKEDLRP